MNNFNNKGPDPKFKLMIVFAILGAIFLLASVIVGNM